MKIAQEPAEPRTANGPAANGPAASMPAASPPVATDEVKGAETAVKTPMSAQLDDLAATVRRLEAFAADEARRVSAKLLPEVEIRAKQNIWVSLLFALGLGLILGLWLNGNRRSD